MSNGSDQRPARSQRDQDTKDFFIIIGFLLTILVFMIAAIAIGNKEVALAFAFVMGGAAWILVFLRFGLSAFIEARKPKTHRR